VPDSSSWGVFLSYRREDAGPYARLLQSQLRERIPDARVFMDLDSIEAGLDFAEVIRAAVDSCTVFVALIGRQWATLVDEQGQRRLDNPDDFVRFEVQTALERGVRVIPVLVDDAKPLRQQELPPELRKLAQLNALEMSYGRYQYDADRLLDLIEQVLAARPGSGTGSYGGSGDNGDNNGGQSTGRRMTRRVRTHPVAAAVIAGAAAVVIAVVAAFATTGHNTALPPSGAPSPGGSTAAAGAPASVPSFTATYAMTRHINVCSPAGTCTTGPLPLTIDCNGSSCTASSGHWGSSHQLAFNGTSFSFTGTDSGVYGCGSPPDPATITLNLTVVSWSGSGATRTPQQLSGPYNVTAPATAGCSAWHLEATLTSQ